MSVPSAAICAACGKAGATSVCSRCVSVRYCNAECQKQHWKAHKPTCVPASTKPTTSAAAAASAVHAPTTAIGVPEDVFRVKPHISAFALSATELGRGNYSCVYKATHKATGQTFAIKEVSKETVDKLAKRSHPNIRHEVLQEKHVGLTVGAHANIARLYATFQSDSHVYYAYEYIAGFELWQALVMPATPRADTPVVPCWAPQGFARQAVRGVIAALAHLHSKGIAHRDLKPENVMMALPAPHPSVPTNRGCALARLAAIAVPKLIDFATSKDLIEPQHNSRTEFVGTPDYMAPEAVDNNKAHAGVPTDNRADLWALGVVAYQLVTGTLPFRRAGGSTYATLQAVTRHDDAAYPGIDHALEFPAGTCDDAKDFIRSLLRRDPSSRLGCRPADLADGAAQHSCGWAREAPLKSADDQPRKAADESSRSSGDAPAMPDNDARSAGSASRVAEPDGESAARGRGAGAAAAARARAKAAQQQGAAAVANKPASSTVPPSLPKINYEAILAHPWLRELGSQGEGVAPDLGDVAYSAVFPWLNDMKLHDRTPADSERCAQICLQLRRISAAPTACLRLMHGLALSRRVFVPHIWKAFHEDLGRARICCTTPWSRVTEAVSVVSRVGDIPPREIVGWNMSPQAYLSADEACHYLAGDDLEPEAAPSHFEQRLTSMQAVPERTSEVLDWRLFAGPDFHCDVRIAVLAHPLQDEAFGKCIRAIGALRPPPRALLFIGSIGDNGLDRMAPALAELHASTSVVLLADDFVSPHDDFCAGWVQGIRIVGVRPTVSADRDTVEDMLDNARCAAQHAVLVRRGPCDALSYDGVAGALPVEALESMLTGANFRVMLQAASAEMPNNGFELWDAGWTHEHLHGPVPVPALATLSKDGVMRVPMLLCTQHDVGGSLLRLDAA